MAISGNSIYLIVENLIRPSYWLTVLLDAIRQRSAYRRQNLVSLGAEQLDQVPASASPVLLYGATPAWIHEAVSVLSRRGIACILLNTEYPKNEENVSVISMDQPSMSECAARYFYETGRRRPAFVYFTPSAPPHTRGSACTSIMSMPSDRIRTSSKRQSESVMPLEG